MSDRQRARRWLIIYNHISVNPISPRFFLRSTSNCAAPSYAARVRSFNFHWFDNLHLHSLSLFLTSNHDPWKWIISEFFRRPVVAIILAQNQTNLKRDFRTIRPSLTYSLSCIHLIPSWLVWSGQYSSVVCACCSAQTSSAKQLADNRS